MNPGTYSTSSTFMCRVACPIRVTISIFPVCMDVALVQSGRSNEVRAALVLLPNKLAFPVRCLPHPESRIHSIFVGQMYSTLVDDVLSFSTSLSQPTLNAKESLSLSAVAFFFDLQYFAAFLSFCSIHTFLLLF